MPNIDIFFGTKKQNAKIYLVAKTLETFTGNINGRVL
jgi:hypothetical protein